MPGGYSFNLQGYGVFRSRGQAKWRTNMIGAFQKIWFLLTPAQHRTGIFLLVLMLIGMALETLGVSLIAPLLALISNPNLLSDYPALAPWLERMGNPHHEYLVIYSMLAIVTVSVIKGLFLVFLSLRQTSFLSRTMSETSLRLKRRISITRRFFYVPTKVARMETH